MTDITYEELEADVIKWAEERGLFDDPNPYAQAAKMFEEASEVLMAIAHGDMDELEDGLGDTHVTLIILAKMFGMTSTGALYTAYHQIKDRKGKTINGQFIKEQPDD